jgi:putative nucleotidyltransferase with HDIG domain
MPPKLALLEPETFHSQDSISLSEVISALSFALDLTEGAVPGHALRSCLIGMRIAAELHLPGDDLQALYYALLLKDVGCSSNAARMCQIVGGDDRAVKAGAKLEDWTKPHKPKISTLHLLWAHVLPGASAARRAARIAKIGLTQHQNNKDLITMRCDRGAGILSKLEMGPLACAAVRCLDEHWNGSGYPDSITGENIPLLARICAVAQHLDVFATDRGTQEAIDVLHERAGAWFDPSLTRIASSLHRSGALWANCTTFGQIESLNETRQAVLDLDPDSHASRRLEAPRVDQICEAFADVVDAKSPFTFRHSVAAADAAFAVAQSMGLPPDRIQLVRRAALLHDLGKLRVPNSILDKKTALSPEERCIVEEHPALTRRILQRIGAFQQIALVAGQHHERLDGTGYPDRLSAKDLSIEARIVAVADVYSALTETRPYRVGLSLREVSIIMESQVPGKLDGDCTVALIAAAAGWQKPSPETRISSSSQLNPIIGELHTAPNRAADTPQLLQLRA